MRLQANIAIDIADVIVFLTDAKEGLTASDEEICDISTNRATSVRESHILISQVSGKRMLNYALVILSCREERDERDDHNDGYEKKQNANGEICLLAVYE